MRSRLIAAGVAGVVVVALAGGAAYIYFFSGLRSSPSALGLSATPTAAASGTTTATTAGGLAGSWTVTTGSVAGYRVKELFVGQTSKHEAVARTSTVSGSLTVSGDSTAGYQVSTITVTVGLTSLHSVDSVAGRDVSQRDGFVARQMNLQQFPDATFTASSVSVAPVASGQPVDVALPGKLTIHGVSKDVTATVKAQQSGSKVEVAGSVAIVMTDYGVTPPSVPFTTVDSQVTIEFDIFLTKTA
jgi:polyisoprenoid-binding protein YceI